MNVHTRDRGLLALFLFTDVGANDAPTELIVGSHLDVPRLLLPYGETGVFFADLAAELPASTFERQSLQFPVKFASESDLPPQPDTIPNCPGGCRTQICR